MDLGLTEEQELLKNSARDFLEKNVPEAYVRQMEEDETGYSPEVWKSMAEQGWQGLGSRLPPAVKSFARWFWFRYDANGKIRQVVEPCAYSRPPPSISLPSAVATCRPAWTTRPSARSGPVSWAIARTMLIFSSMVV